MSMYSFADLVIIAVLGLFLGVFIMMIGFKLWLYMQYPKQFSEKDDWPQEDWVIGYEVTDDES